MAPEALTPSQVVQVQQIAELETRRYFDHYLTEVWPQQQKALREHTHLMIEKHDDSDEAHGGVERRFNRTLWLAMGSALTGGMGGAGLMQLLTNLAH